MFEDINDEMLVKQAQQGDKCSVDELLKRYRDLVKINARGFFLVGAEAEDLIQEGMCGLYMAIMDYNDAHNCLFKTFATLCIRRRLITAVKQSTSQKSLPLNNYASIFDETGEEILVVTDTHTPEEILISKERRIEIQNQIKRQLSQLEYKIFSLYMKGKSYNEICESSNKNFKTVDNALQRAKNKVAKILNKG